MKNRSFGQNNEKRFKIRFELNWTKILDSLSNFSICNLFSELLNRHFLFNIYYQEIV